MLRLTASLVQSCRHDVSKGLAAASSTQNVRGILGGADHGKKEPTASPWVKVLERPGDEHGNRSEEVQIENPYKNKDAPDASADAPEKNPDRQPKAPIDPNVMTAAEANKHSDSVRMMADKLNQAVGGEPDFPKTGGASIREMASEIGSNVADKLGVHMNSNSAINSKADEAMSRAADKGSDAASSVVDKAKEAVTGSSNRSA